MIVLHYIPTIDRRSGGVGFYMQLTAKELGKIVDLHIVTTKSEYELRIENCELHHISCGISPRAKREWCAIINSVRPDVVHINCCWTPQCSFAQRWAQELGYRVVLTPHGMLEPWIIKRNFWSRKLPALLLYQRRAVKEADMIHATALSERDNLAALGYNHNIHIIPNGVELSCIELKGSWAKQKKILFLSRIHPKKGIELLIESIANLSERLTGYQFIIAGEGEPSYIKTLNSKAQRLGVEHLLNICGGVYGDSKWDLYKLCDIFILPTYSENFGIVVAEALSCGTPVITTSGTPWQELNTSGCGWCVDPNTKSITEALRQALTSSPQELEQMGRRGRRLIEGSYSTEIVARKLEEMYKLIISPKEY